MTKNFNSRLAHLRMMQTLRDAADKRMDATLRDNDGKAYIANRAQSRFLDDLIFHFVSEVTT